MQSDILNTLHDRGFVHQATDLVGLDAAACEGKLTAYIGFDLTADSLHVGSLIQLMVIRRLLDAGHKPIVLLGGATTMVGDPTGKDTSRPLLDAQDIEHNRQGILSVIHRVVGKPVEVVNNNQWFQKIHFLEFLREFGPHFSVNRMLTLDSVKTRLSKQDPMSFLEFNYMIMQAVDFLELNREHGCVLQIGGSDQWGNIINGVELVRKVDGKTVFGLTTPLLTNVAGEKMGKTASGAVWLSEDKTSVFDFWQFWRNVEDSKVEAFLRLFTDEHRDMIDHLVGLNGPGINAAKKFLATEVTAIVHGREKADIAQRAAEDMFEIKQAGAASSEVSIARGALLGFTIADLVVHLGLVKSKNDADRLALNGGIRLNGVKIGDARLVISPVTMGFTIAVGQKNVVSVKVTG